MPIRGWNRGLRPPGRAPPDALRTSSRYDPKRLWEIVGLRAVEKWRTTASLVRPRTEPRSYHRAVHVSAYSLTGTARHRRS
jgi:hypothetical protein